MGIFSGLMSGFKGHFDKQKEQREAMDKLRLEAEMQRTEIFEQEFKKNALEVACAKAKKDAARLSGLQKLRAQNRARRLTEPGSEQTMQGKFSAYLQQNLARKEENLSRTEELRKTAKKMREDKLVEMQQKRKQNTQRSFNRGSTWRM